MVDNRKLGCLIPNMNLISANDTRQHHLLIVNNLT